jgi:competence protein ComEC
VRTRLPLFLAALVGAGLAFSIATPTTTTIIAMVGLTLVAAGLSWRADALSGWALLCMCGLLACSHGLWVRHRMASAWASVPSGTIVVEGVITDVQVRGHSVAVAIEATGHLHNDQAHAWPESLMVELSLTEGAAAEQNLAVLVPGSTVRARGKLKAPRPALMPGDYDGERVALSRGMSGRMSVRDPTAIAAMTNTPQASWTSQWSTLRGALRERVMATLPPRHAAVLLTLLIGDVSLLEEDHRLAYRRVGASHLLAVSGLQVTLLAVVIGRLVRGLWMLTSWGRRARWRGMPVVIASAAVIAFVCLCGAPPSAVRAGIMAIAVVVSQAWGRSVLMINVLAVAGLVTVVAAPASVFDAGFLLSYGALLGLVASSGPSADGPPSLTRRATTIVIASVGAAVLTLPISIWLFGELAWVGMFSNIVLVPVASALQLPALVGGLLGLVWSPLLWVGAQAGLVLDALVIQLATWSPAILLVEAPSLLTAAGWWLAGVAACLLLAKQRFAHTALLLLLVAAITVWREWPPHGARVTFLPVGQGDAALIEFSNGQTMLVDGGGNIPMGGKGEGTADDSDPGLQVVLPLLQRRGIDHLDVVVMSHAHPDHALGLQALVRAQDGQAPIRIDQFWYAPTAHDRPDGYAAPLKAAATHTKTTPSLLGVHPFGEEFVVVMAPNPQDGSASYEEFGANDNSVVIKVCRADDCVLLPGDIEEFGETALVEQHGAELRSAVVKAAHHGSRTSSTPAFVAATGAKAVVFCTGHQNLFGFPHAVVDDRWAASGALRYNTAREGEVRVWLTGHGTVIQPHRVVAIDGSRLTAGAKVP